MIFVVFEQEAMRYPVTLGIFRIDLVYRTGRPVARIDNAIVQRAHSIVIQALIEIIIALGICNTSGKIRRTKKQQSNNSH